jgi:membrane protein YqaA with SNARE-associated domain
MQKQTWQSTLIAALIIGLAGAVFLVVYIRSGINDALKAWAAIGTIGGVITGIIPAYFFGQQRAQAAENQAQEAMKTADEERAHRNNAESLAKIALGHLSPPVTQQLQNEHPDLFAPN